MRDGGLEVSVSELDIIKGGIAGEGFQKESLLALFAITTSPGFMSDGGLEVPVSELDITEERGIAARSERSRRRVCRRCLLCDVSCGS